LVEWLLGKQWMHVLYYSMQQYRVLVASSLVVAHVFFVCFLLEFRRRHRPAFVVVAHDDDDVDKRTRMLPLISRMALTLAVTVVRGF